MDYTRSCALEAGRKCTRIKFKGPISTTLLEKKLGKNSGLLIQMSFHLFGSTDGETLQSLPLTTPNWWQSDFHHPINSKQTKIL